MVKEILQLVSVGNHSTVIMHNTRRLTQNTSLLNFHRSVEMVRKRRIIYTGSQIKAKKNSRCDQTEPHNVFVVKNIIGAGNQMEVTLNSTKSSSYKIFRGKYFCYNGLLKLSDK